MTQDQPTGIQLSDDRGERVLHGLGQLTCNHFDENLTDFQVQAILDYFIKTLGPPVYNQAIVDGRTFLAGKLEDLEAEFYEQESE